MGVSRKPCLQLSTISFANRIRKCFLILAMTLQKTLYKTRFYAHMRKEIKVKLIAKTAIVILAKTGKLSGPSKKNRIFIHSTNILVSATCQAQSWA